MYPGRWNNLGQTAIYTSIEKSLALLEMLAHTPKDEIPSNLAFMKIRIEGNWEDHNNALIDPGTGGCFWFERTLVNAKLPWFGGGINPFAVAVPSAIVPVWNVVLYPQAVGFRHHVTLESIEPFDLDPRLFPENTPTEAR